MPDLSDLDLKYFIDRKKYNCPFCNRRHVSYAIRRIEIFDWNEEKKCYVIFVECASCHKVSLHLTYNHIVTGLSFNADIDIDSNIFYSVPTCYFVIDDNIPKVLRELIVEAEGSLKMNFLTGASACVRKTVYELLLLEKAEGIHYDDKIKDVKKKHPEIDSTHFDILGHLTDMTSDKVHEDSWKEWDSGNLKLILETLKSIFKDIYVLPKEKEERKKKILELKEKISKPKVDNQEENKKQ